MRPRRQKLTATVQHIQKKSDPRNILCRHRGGRRSGDSPMEYQHKEQIQSDIQQRCRAEEPERRNGIADRTQKAGKKIV